MGPTDKRIPNVEQWTALGNLLDGKQDELTAGDGITIEDESGSLVISATGGGGGSSPAIELTSADYNYHSSGDVDDGVAVWLLDRGYYCLTGPAKIYWTSTASETISAKVLFVISHTNYDGITGHHKILLLGSKVNIGGQNFGPIYNYAVGSTGTSTDYDMTSKNGYLLTGGNIANATGNSADVVMSQNATTSMVFADPSTKKRVAIGPSTLSGSSVGDYGVQIGYGAKAANSYCVAIGGSDVNYNGAMANTCSVAVGAESKAGYGSTGANTGERAVAVGYGSRATPKGSVAVGFQAVAETQGEFSINTTSGYGYNNSNYRLLTGLYDPQSAHDAATKGYVDPTTDSTAPTTATVGRLGQIQIDTSTNTAYMCVSVDDTTPAYGWKQITA